MSGHPEFDHLLVTRFNIIQVEMMFRRGVYLDEGWMERRLGLFERYCASSVAAQRDQAFAWAILVHPRTPDSVRRRLTQAASTVEVLVVETRRAEAGLRRAVRQRRHRAPFVITSRLDSDDALHVSYIERLHAAFAGQEFQALDFPWGYMHDPRSPSLRRCRKPSNPFVSLVERVSERPRTVHAANHKRIGDIAPVRDLGEGPAWMQVVHGDNVRNKMKGRPVGGDVAALLRDEFGVRQP